MKETYETDLINKINHGRKTEKPYRLTLCEIEMLIDETIENIRNGIFRSVNGILDFSNGLYFTKCEKGMNREPGKRSEPLLSLKNGCLKGVYTDLSSAKETNRKDYFRTYWNHQFTNLKD